MGNMKEKEKEEIIYSKVRLEKKRRLNKNMTNKVPQRKESEKEVERRKEKRENRIISAE